MQDSLRVRLPVLLPAQPHNSFQRPVTAVRTMIHRVILSEVWPVSGQTQSKDLQFRILTYAIKLSYTTLKRNRVPQASIVRLGDHHRPPARLRFIPARV